MESIEFKVQQKLLEIQMYFDEEHQKLEQKLEHTMKQGRRNFEYLKNYVSLSEEREERITEISKCLQQNTNEQQQNKELSKEFNYFVDAANKRLDALENCFFILNTQNDQSIQEINEIKKSIEDISQKVDNLSNNTQPVEEETINKLADSLKSMNEESIKINNRLKKQQRLINDMFHY